MLVGGVNNEFLIDNDVVKTKQKERMKKTKKKRRKIIEKQNCVFKKRLTNAAHEVERRFKKLSTRSSI